MEIWGFFQHKICFSKLYWANLINIGYETLKKSFYQNIGAKNKNNF